MLQFLEEIVEMVRLDPFERAQWIDEQVVEVPTAQITEEIGEEIVDVLVPPVDATEALQLKIQREFFDIFTTKEACLAG